MIKEIANCFKLLKHGYQVKTNLLAWLLFIPIGISFIAAGYERLPLCAVYFFLGVMFLAQSMYMTLFSGLVAASPGRKKLEFLYLNIIHSVGGIVAAVITLIVAFVAKPKRTEGATMEALLVISGLMAIAMYCYISLAYKSMLFGFVVFMISFFAVMNLPYGTIGERLGEALQGKTVLAVPIFLVEVVLGIVLGHGIRKLFYRKNMSKWAAGAKLRAEQ